MKRNLPAALLLSSFGVCVTPPVMAAGFIAVDPIVATPAPRMTAIQPVWATSANTPRPNATLLKGSIGYGLHLQSTHVTVEVKEQVAHTYVTQTFVNDTDNNLAGTYLFPLPADTTFSSFTLQIDGKPVEGKILEAGEARREYETIVRHMIDPGLLEYADQRTVRARVFPIPPHGTKQISLEYTQILHADSGMIKYQFPLKTEHQELPVDNVTLDVKLASSDAGVRTIWSPSHKIDTRRNGEHSATVAYSAHDFVPDKDFTLYYTTSKHALAANVLTQKEADKDGYFLLSITPPTESKQIAAKDIVLIVDTSGSMAGEKLNEAKQALKYIIRALNPEDHFDLVQFNTDVDQLDPELLVANKANKQLALNYIDALDATGGTNIGSALSNGLSVLPTDSNRPTYLILVTDGQPTVGSTSVKSLLETIPRKRNLRVFDFGVGTDVNTELLDKLANSHHGTSQYVDSDEDLELALSGFYTKIKNPVLTDVSIKYSGVQVKNIYPKEVSDIFSGSQVMVLGRYKGSGTATVSLSGKMNGVAQNFDFPLTFASAASEHPYLPRLWAMRRIGYLTETARENGNTREVVDEIVSLSKQYGIISAYTSFLATDPNDSAPRARLTPPPGFAVAPVIFPTRLRDAAASASADRARPIGARADRDVDFGPEMIDIQRRIKRAWFPPKGCDSKKVIAQFKLHRDGSISDVTIHQSSNLAVADQAARQAIENASPFKPLPSNSPDSVDVQFNFDYNILTKNLTASNQFGSGSNEIASALSSTAASGETAVARSKIINEYKTTTTESQSATTKTVGSKTFQLIDGTWVDSSYDPQKSPKPELIKLCSDRYFAVIAQVKGLAQYLSVGRKVIVVMQDHCYQVE